MRQGVQLADLLKVSEEEMCLLTGETDPEKGAARLMAMGPGLVLVSMGEKGAYYQNKMGGGLVPTFDVETVDTTGAGDAFWGAVLHQLRGKTAAELAQMPSQQLQQVVRFGNAAGSLTTMKSGAIPAMPTQEEIEACLKTRKLMEA